MEIDNLTALEARNGLLVDMTNAKEVAWRNPNLVPYTDAIPSDYDGLMGVPITFLAKYCPEQFEIVNGMNRYMILGEEELNEKIRVAHSHLCNIEGKASYFRILIRKRAKK